MLLRKSRGMHDVLQRENKKTNIKGTLSEPQWCVSLRNRLVVVGHGMAIFWLPSVPRHRSNYIESTKLVTRHVDNGMSYEFQCSASVFYSRNPPRLAIFAQKGPKVRHGKS